MVPRAVVRWWWGVEQWRLPPRVQEPTQSGSLLSQYSYVEAGTSFYEGLKRVTKLVAVFLIQIQYKYTNRQMPSPAQNSHNFWLWSNCVFHQNCDNVGRQSSTVQTLAQWRHPVASSETLDVLHEAMHPASHRHNPMVIKIASNFLLFLLSCFCCCPSP